ncbi:Exosome complex component RRP41 [Physocladia obscura]|uniref:Ribosomal RNA-processing protein 41 n=1 Tax=Physocladia obscura TaxID=109957 RepID=A0AAD5SXP8_9FUNG|nr:Exosome complex component RRP41 [Physocladia obscura]
MGKTEVVTDEGFRIDGRRAHELRRVVCTVGGESYVADGEAMIDTGNTKCLVRVFGPREPTVRSNVLLERASVVVDFNLAAFSSGERKQKLRQDKRLLEMASLIKSTFEAAILTQSFPRSEIAIQIQILQFDGGSLHAAINTTTLALMNAGIPMLDFVVASSAGFANGTTILDVNYTEESMDVPTLSLAMMPRSGKVVLLNLESRLHLNEFEGVLRLAKEGCTRMYGILDEAVRRN